MPTTVVTIPDGIAWVALSLVSVNVLLMSQMTTVGKYRRIAKIPYPQMYAEKAEAEASRDAYVFNCAQRAHQNTLENVAVVVTSTLITAVSYPLVAASGCALWVFGRALYTRGYIQDPEVRNTHGGYIGSFGQTVVMLGSMISTIQLLKAQFWL
ncbi:hypothetical protein CPB85DRAFT_543349 [Mucidula mucida]|nr:hypothetical protein CPB85DRAFT_543349 [Mucidula mucida]